MISAKLEHPRDASFSVFAQQYLDALHATLGPFKAWSEDYKHWIPGRPPDPTGDTGLLYFRLAHGAQGHLQVWSSSAFLHEVTLGRVPGEPTTPAWYHAVHRLIAHMFEHSDLCEARVVRGLNVVTMPKAPFAGGDAMGRGDAVIRLLSTSQILDHYRSVSEFLAGWDGHTKRGDRYLVYRGLDCETDRAFTEAQREKNRALGRAAKPGFTRYRRVLGAMQPWEQTWWDAGEPTLSWVGTHAATGRCEFSAFVPPGQHILPREIYRVRAVVRGKLDEHGTPVTDVRVVFPNRQMAVAEGTPLMDVGASVYFMDQLGDDLLLGGPSASSKGKRGKIVR